MIQMSFDNVLSFDNGGVMAWDCKAASGTGSLIFIVTYDGSSSMNQAICLPIYKKWIQTKSEEHHMDKQNTQNTQQMTSWGNKIEKF